MDVVIVTDYNFLKLQTKKLMIIVVVVVMWRAAVSCCYFDGRQTLRPFACGFEQVLKVAVIMVAPPRIPSNAHFLYKLQQLTQGQIKFKYSSINKKQINLQY